MEKNLFEVGANIDLVALMSRLRETAKKRGTGGSSARSPVEPEQKILRTLQPQRLSQEIQAGAPSVDVINWIPLKGQGTKGGIEFRVKKFLKWLVHWNTKGQAEFNHSVMRSLGLVAEDLQSAQESFVTIEALVRDIAAQSSELEQKRQSELRAAVSPLREDLDRNGAQTRLLTEQASAFSSRLEESDAAAAKVARHLEATLREEMNRLLMDHASCFSAILEQKVGPMIEESAQHLETDFGAADATLLEEMNRLLTLQVSNFSAMLESVQRLRADFGAGEALREEMKEIRSETETLDAQSSDLKGNFHHELDELRIRILRAERLARNSRRAIDAEQVASEYHSDVQPDIRDQETNGNEEAGTGTRTSNGQPFGQAFDYFLFEHKHRGPVSEIKRRQSTYLDLFLGRQNVVDLGCGRGEFVELLTENGINVTGVDSSPDMVDFCGDRGLTVVQADMFEYLSGLPDGKLDGIFLSQVVEHVSPEQILKLLGLCAEKLEPGAVIVIETMNTNCPAALSNFFVDPTHVRPVPAEMLRFMAEQASFQVKYLRFTSPLPGNGSSEILDFASGLTSEVMVYQDYAVVAIKR